MIYFPSTNSEECIERNGKSREKKEEIQGTRIKICCFIPSFKMSVVEYKERWI
jgi:hypothetical protein